MQILRDWRSVVIAVLVVLMIVAASSAQQAAPAWEYAYVVWTEASLIGQSPERPAEYVIYRGTDDFEVGEMPIVGSARPNAIELLNQLGAQGWELVSTLEQQVRPGMRFYLKRRAS